jgi:hypothetical protein
MAISYLFLAVWVMHFVAGQKVTSSAALLWVATGFVLFAMVFNYIA